MSEVKISEREKMLIESMQHLISFYGYIVLPVGMLPNLQWYYIEKKFKTIKVKIDSVDFYRVEIKGELNEN